MSLAEIPMLFVLAGLILYVVLAGADFGAALWQVSAPRTAQGERLRTLAHDAMGPVWEANHVWLIFVLTVTWTAYPAAFGSLASTLCIALSIAAFGIIVRGAAYAMASGTTDPRELRRIDAASAISSVLAPFALGACVGALALGRVPYGNAAGNLWSSWLNPTSILIGILAVVFSAYLAAVYLAADTLRLGEHELELDFRVRALAAGVVAGGLALAGLLVVRQDSPALWHGLAHGAGLAMIGVSGAAGALTLVLVFGDRFGLARASAALAVAATIAGWAVAQKPFILPGLTIEQAAAGRSSLVAIVVAVAAGSVVLIPALILLFGLFLRGRLGPSDEPAPAAGARPVAETPQPRALTVFAGLTLVVGAALMMLLDSGWAHIAGVVCLFAGAVSAFLLAAAAPDELAEEPRSRYRRSGS
jgi:cytochrome d ubiquinol oxidase subunit II